jgi:hypothetical protein
MNSDLTLLGIREGFSQSELRAAYRARVRLVHPDLATSDADRVRRTRETIRLNAAYAELRNAPTRMTPQSVPQKVREEPQFAVKTPIYVVRTTRGQTYFLCARDTLSVILGAIVAGIAASTITGQLLLTVGVMVGGTVLARWAHVRDDSRYWSTVHTI